MTLWALMFLPSQVSVTSTKSSEHFNESNALTILDWKLFQRKQNWSAIPKCLTEKSVITKNIFADLILTNVTV